MSEARSINKKAIAIVITVITILIVLVGIYFAGNFILPNGIKASYQNKNCDQVLAQDNFYTSIYPAFMADQSVASLTSECALYSLGLEDEAKKTWQDAYNVYKTYTQSYPKGLFASEAQEHSATVLTALAKDQLAAKKYSDAIGNINLVLQSFGETSAAANAASLMPEVYIAWAKDQRDASDFAGAEATLKTLKAWAESAQKPDDAKSAQRELAHTYLAWGLAFQTQKQFEDAKAKLDLAISTDPEPLANAGPAMQAKTAQVKLFTEWGDTLIEKSDFTGALDRYQMVISLSPEKDQPAAKDMIANVYIKWAASLSSSEDFLGALNKIDDAAKNAATDARKKSVESAKTDTYTAFSKSSGSQAQKAMKDAIKTICEKNKKPDLPIFGLNKEHIFAGIYGVDDTLPDNVAAKTPGTLHYVACIEMTTETLARLDFFGIMTFVREKYTWNVTLRQVSSGEIAANTKVTGGDPPPIPEITRSNVLDYIFGGRFYRSRGSNPDAVTLANWLLTVMK
jgi:tetratricopeptide (TPR) repeat protein